MRGLLFDFDGTIADTERFGHRVAYNRAFAELGLDWNWSEELYGELLAVAGGKERLRHFIARYHPELAPGGEVPDALVAEIYRVKRRNFVEVAATIPLRRGVQRLIGEAHAAGLRIGIATTGSQDGVEALLAQDPALLRMIDVIAGSETVERKKPAPDVYLWALAHLGLAASECVAIEDSNVGLRSALAAGITTVVTVSDYTAHEDFSGAAAVVWDLDGGGSPARGGSMLRQAQHDNGAQHDDGVVDLAFLRSVLARVV